MLIGYVHPFVVPAGAPVELMVSTTEETWSHRLVRVRHGDRNPAGPGFKVEAVAGIAGEGLPGFVQETRAGSFAQAPPLPGLASARRVELRLWAQPTLLGRRQVLLSGGFELALTGEGRFELSAGGEALVLPEPARARAWHRIRAEIDLDEGALRLAVSRARGLPAVAGDELRAEQRVAGLEAAFTGPIVMAGHFNGKLEAPEIHADGRCVARWDFGDGFAGDEVPDRGPDGCHARLINGPARAVTGTRWVSATTDFKAAPEQYAAVHFHDDDLDDARWEPGLRLELPPDLPSGVYAFEVRAGELTDHVPFVVTAGTSGRAPVAVVLPTFTYSAYANERMADRFDFHEDGVREQPVELGEHDRLLAEHPEWGRSLYDLHDDGSPVVTSSLRRPVPNLRPDYRSWLQDAARHLGADLYLTDWLDAQGIEYDVVTDHCLHTAGAGVLDGCAVAITGSHPEYSSEAMLDGYEAFLARGGSLLYLGGNGFYWATSTVAGAPWCVEVRRGPAGTRSSESAPGEGHHASTGEPGGLWRHRGRPPNQLVGLGFTSEGWDSRAPGYRRTEASYDERFAWVFDGIGPEERLGEFGLVMGGTAGDEIDRADPALGTPPEAVVLATSTGHSDCYQLAVEEVQATAPGLGGTENALVRSDIVLFETPAGGAVFSAGSICFSGALSHAGYDNNVSRMVGNVVRALMRR
jgi:N,N-dimethylformamidase